MVMEERHINELLERLLRLTEEGKLQWRQVGASDYETEIEDEQGRIRFMLTLFPVPEKPPTATGRMRLMPEEAAPFMTVFKVEAVCPTLLLFEPHREEPILRLRSVDLDEHSRDLLERLYKLLEKPTALEGISFMERALRALERIG